MPGEAIPSSLETRIRHLARSMRQSAMIPDRLQPAHIGLQRLGDRNAAVMALEVFQDRDQRAADCEAGAIEGVNRPRPLAARRAIAGLHALRLERPAIRAARNFAI